MYPVTQGRICTYSRLGTSSPCCWQSERLVEHEDRVLIASFLLEQHQPCRLGSGLDVIFLESTHAFFDGVALDHRLVCVPHSTHSRIHHRQVVDRCETKRLHLVRDARPLNALHFGSQGFHGQVRERIPALRHLSAVRNEELVHEIDIGAAALWSQHAGKLAEKLLELAVACQVDYAAVCEDEHIGRGFLVGQRRQLVERQRRTERPSDGGDAGMFQGLPGGEVEHVLLDVHADELGRPGGYLERLGTRFVEQPKDGTTAAGADVDEGELAAVSRVLGEHLDKCPASRRARRPPDPDP